MAERALKRTIFGAVIFFLALVSTVMVYITTEPFWSHLFLWPVVIYGAIVFLTGFSNWLKYQ